VIWVTPPPPARTAVWTSSSPQPVQPFALAVHSARPESPSGTGASVAGGTPI